MTGSKQALGNTYTKRSRAAYEFIAAKRNRPWQGEEEVRLAWVSALEAALGIHFDAERAKKDSSYFNVIVEFKAPGLFKGKKASAKFKEATDGRLLPYIQREAKKSGIPQDDYIGIAIVGDHICFVQVVDNVIQTQHLIPFSEYAVGLVIQAIKADFGKLTDHRAKNAKIALDDAIMSAFAMFHLKDQSLLAFDERRRWEPKNLHTVYGVADIPCDSQMRAILEALFQNGWVKARVPQKSECFALDLQPLFYRKKMIQPPPSWYASLKRYFS